MPVARSVVCSVWMTRGSYGLVALR
jgi:hypothetical protein